MHPFFDTCKSLLEADLHIDFMRGLLQLSYMNLCKKKRCQIKLKSIINETVNIFKCKKKNTYDI